jgi:DNA-binding PadR family transcriptional regulator
LEAELRERMFRGILLKAELKKFQNKTMRNLLDYLVLHLLKDQPMHGYCILSAIRERYGYYVASRVIYFTLSTFEKKKYVKSRLESRGQGRKSKKIYSITSKGRTILDFEEQFLNHIIKMANSEGRKTI